MLGLTLGLLGLLVGVGGGGGRDALAFGVGGGGLALAAVLDVVGLVGARARAVA